MINEYLIAFIVIKLLHMWALITIFWVFIYIIIYIKFYINNLKEKRHFGLRNTP